MPEYLLTHLCLLLLLLLFYIHLSIVEIFLYVRIPFSKSVYVFFLCNHLRVETVVETKLDFELVKQQDNVVQCTGIVLFCYIFSSPPPLQIH